MKRVVATAVALMVGVCAWAPAAAADATTTTDAGTDRSATTPVAGGSPTDSIPVPVLEDGEFDSDATVQVSYVHLPTGFRADSANAGEIRTCLSICKLYIADHVFREGDEDQRNQATQMLRTSDDGITTRLYREFPESIDEVAERYDLEDTDGARRWGKSRTTMHDAVTFLAGKVDDGHADDPLLMALATPSPIAADGYRQDYGTDVLPGVVGTKWGWANDRDAMNASVSYGRDFVVGLSVLDDADAATDMAEELFEPAPRGEFVVEDGALAPAGAVLLSSGTASAAGGSSSSAGDWIAGALLLVTAAGIAWVFRGRKR
ncbi:hypothetical protein ACFWGD_02570 [Corynebacterium sp. NPDC060344]|uniref:hypothetical protein n=1 Tax=Corynebacterium sp. NPDC060344 TaxID=3347101 RepID=UPI0036494396